MTAINQTTWTCPRGHEVSSEFDFCPQDGSRKPSQPSAAWAVPNGSPQSATWGASNAWQAPSPPRRGLTVGGIIAIAVAALIVLGGAIGLVAWGISSANNGGFNNVSTLQDSIQSKYGSSLSKYGVSVTDVTCIGAGDHQFNCLLTFSDDTTASHHVTVSSDGNSWVSDNTP